MQVTKITTANGLGWELPIGEIISAVASTAISVGGSFATASIATSAVKKQIQAQADAQIRINASNSPTSNASVLSNPTVLAGAGIVGIGLLFLLLRK